MTATVNSTAFVALGPNTWGIGATAAEAKANLRRQGGNLARYLVVQMPEGALEAWVDTMGTLRWEWADGADRTGLPVQVEGNV